MFRVLVFAGAVMLTAVGCGDVGPKLYDVRGIVTWNGDPLPSGNIVFESPDYSAKASAAKIVDGKYHFKTALGPKRVRISSMRDTGVFDEVMQENAYKQFLPARYNSETTLNVEVTEGGENRFKFDLAEKE